MKTYLITYRIRGSELERTGIAGGESAGSVLELLDRAFPHREIVTMEEIPFPAATICASAESEL